MTLFTILGISLSRLFIKTSTQDVDVDTAWFTHKELCLFLVGVFIIYLGFLFLKSIWTNLNNPLKKNPQFSLFRLSG